MKNIKPILAALLLFCSTNMVGQTTIGTLLVDGLNRAYRLYVPPGLDLTTPRPLVFNFHGYTSNAFQQQGYTNFDQVARNNDFLVCYPEGLLNSWNVGWAFGTQSDDVAFIDDLIDSLAVNYNIDLTRVYSCGMSNGGFFSYELACELPDRIAAIASVTGSMVTSHLNTCDPGRAIPVMQIHGTADPTVLYGGNFLGVGIEQLVSTWVELNGCTTPADTSIIENTNTSDQTTAIRIDYTSCDDEAEVAFYKIENGGHTWPDATVQIGVTNRDFNASEEIWRFFERFSNPLLTSSENIVEEPVSVNVFPNPVTDNLSIETNGVAIRSIQCYDNGGRMILSENSINENKLTLDFGHLNPGLFWVSVHTAEGTQLRAVVKQ